MKTWGVFLLLGIGMGLVTGVAGARAADISQRTDYRVSLAGISVARASFATRISGSSYSVSGQVKAAGIVDFFTSFNARTETRGRVEDGALKADDYVLTYTRGKRTRVYSVGFRGDDVVSTTIEPQPGRPKEWVPVTPEDLRKVVDPVSGIILPPGREGCSGALQVYDGETRFDLVLSPKRTDTYALDGYSGPVAVCSARYVPKAGYRAGRKDIEYMKKARGIEIWFAKAGALQLTAPVYARIPTEYGTLSIAATRISN